jgi:diaminopimelate decarboxylase
MRFTRLRILRRCPAIIFEMTSVPAMDLRFRVSEQQARDLVQSFGTPLYVIDEGHLRSRIRRYRTAFAAVYPHTELVFASKANSALAVLKIVHEEGCKIDVASEGEFRAALLAGVPAADCHLHGNNKSIDELQVAWSQGIGRIVADNFEELEAIHNLLERGSDTKVVLRLAPGVDPITHAKISTGQADTKFGFNIGDGSAERATLRCLELGLPLTGFHCHVGSQLLDPEAQRSGGELITAFARQMQEKHGFAASYINVGGGLGVRYLESDQPMPIEDYCRLVVEAVLSSVGDLRPVIAQEPGRALVAESGVTLYTVGNLKTVPSKELGSRTYVSVDGGLSDNPRPALYGARYTVLRAARGAAGSQGGECKTVTVVGKHCETDKLFEHVDLPSDLQAGDILQVLCTGAYNSSMASNYNRFRRPPCVLIREDGSHALIQRAETWDEMFARESLPEDL